ncbi:hypothetical protein [Comamonas testosteroni]|uniref:hypothetical protein n=1 Tax=Comamonas testosteroni TaxID=285 RepID=UPI00391A2849
MSEAKHTPGPWEATGNLVRSPMHQPEGLPRGVQIVECRDGYFLPHTEEAKANARLIAAAPELLEALQEFDDAMKEAGDWPGTTNELQRLLGVVDKARAAIAKSKGQLDE